MSDEDEELKELTGSNFRGPAPPDQLARAELSDGLACFSAGISSRLLLADIVLHGAAHFFGPIDH